MARYLITGAAGFTGRYLVEALALQGHEVHGLTNGAVPDSLAGLMTNHVGNLNDPASLAGIIAKVQPDHVAHLAAIAFVAHADVEEMYRTNIYGTRTLLDQLYRSGHHPQSVLVASSANIYGNNRAGVLDESMAPTPANDYGVTKTAMEQVCALYADRLPIIITRPFNYTGVGQSTQFFVPKVIDHARRRAPAIELGNVEVARDFSDVRGVVDAYIRLMASHGAVGGTFNICSGHAITLLGIVQAIENLADHRFDIRVNPAFIRADEVRTLVGSSSRLENVIGKFAMPPIEDTLSWMLNT